MIFSSDKLKFWQIWRRLWDKIICYSAITTATKNRPLKIYHFQNWSTLNLWINFIETMAMLFQEWEKAVIFAPKYYNIDFHMNKVLAEVYAQKLSNKHRKPIPLNAWNPTVHFYATIAYTIIQRWLCWRRRQQSTFLSLN